MARFTYKQETNWISSEFTIKKNKCYWLTRWLSLPENFFLIQRWCCSNEQINVEFIERFTKIEGVSLIREFIIVSAYSNSWVHKYCQCTQNNGTDWVCDKFSSKAFIADDKFDVIIFTINHLQRPREEHGAPASSVLLKKKVSIAFRKNCSNGQDSGRMLASCPSSALALEISSVKGHPYDVIKVKITNKTKKFRMERRGYEKPVLV